MVVIAVLAVSRCRDPGARRAERRAALRVTRLGAPIAGPPDQDVVWPTG